jgi:hypothetical protein
MYLKTDNPRKLMEHIGREYVESDRLPHEGSERVKVAYERIATRVMELYRQIPIPVIWSEQDPYVDYEHMAKEVIRESKLRIYSGHLSHPCMTQADNFRYRAVHDYWGHLTHDTDFTPEGEYQKWLNMSPQFPVGGTDHTISRILFGEVVGQVAAVHYLDDGFESDRFQQRAFVAPKAWLQASRFTFD